MSILEIIANGVGMLASVVIAVMGMYVFTAEIPEDE